MRAAVCTAYGPPDVVREADVDTPVPGPNQVLVRVHAATVTAADRAFRSGTPRYARLFAGLRRPKKPVLGTEYAGEVSAVGAAVTRYAVGDKVFGATDLGLGAHAEYVCVNEDGALATLPSGLGYADAVTLVDGTALVFLRDHAKLHSGQSILVNGASGSVGVQAVQFARYFGADITAVCSGAGADLVTRLGAHRVVDYTRTDFTEEGHTYDVVFDVAGTSSYGRCRRVLKPGGRYLTTVPSLAIMVQAPWTAVVGSRRAVVAFTGLRPVAAKAKDLAFVRELAEAGRIVPVVDQTVPLARVADAYRHLDRQGKRGTTVLDLP
ncbi:NAD(P)-dependent alcohol dehydrogenase [Phytohabitans suffuscus]|uniref:NADPH:quinone oxidoreductase n=1 Tax=Phytohabitans suffuscus TaxID=624315 RepID=A0A6F8YCG2_9ACTN|nr:NAD(P)-dependent alcohol dehydrogenase [Phytohabitans suffuscus]BCB83805.1 NADPH:quinone oxidoreductase [Phytohabitans suffuscus]